jgi:hypothetical protein
MEAQSVAKQSTRKPRARLQRLVHRDLLRRTGIQVTNQHRQRPSPQATVDPSPIAGTHLACQIPMPDRLMRRSCLRHRAIWTIWCLVRFRFRRMTMPQEGLRRLGRIIRLHLWFGMISVEKYLYKSVSPFCPNFCHMIDEYFFPIGCYLIFFVYLISRSIRWLFPSEPYF